MKIGDIIKAKDKLENADKKERDSYYIKLVTGGMIKMPKSMTDYLELTPKEGNIIWNQNLQSFEPLNKEGLALLKKKFTGSK